MYYFMVFPSSVLCTTFCSNLDKNQLLSKTIHTINWTLDYLFVTHVYQYCYFKIMFTSIENSLKRLGLKKYTLFKGLTLV